jgi:hypothetical protein
MTTVTSTVEVVEPYKILKFTVTSVGESVSTEIVYEIPPGSIVNGVWDDTTADDFSEPELKEIITDYQYLWTDSVKAAYKSYLLSGS